MKAKLICGDLKSVLKEAKRMGCKEVKSFTHIPLENVEIIISSLEKTADDEKIKKIARHYGYEAQSRQCIEEMAELTQAINKYWRKDLQCGKYPYNPWDGYMPDGSEEYQNLLEEIADVQIMLEQMKFFLDPINVEHIDEIIEEKIDRQLRRMEEESCKE